MLKHSFSAMFVAAIIVLGLYVSFGFAQTQSASDTHKYITERVPDDLVTAARDLHVQAPIAGDLAAAGGRITIDGPIDGYVMSAGRTVTLDGAVGNDVWAAGETVAINSDVRNNAMIAGRTVQLGADASIGHDARIAGDMVTTQGHVERNLKIGATTAQIGGTVGGNVEAAAQKVTVLPRAVINGDLIVRAAEPPDISPEAQVLGQVRYEEMRQSQYFTWPWIWAGGFLALLILGLAAVAFSSAWPARVAGTLRARPGISIAAGIALVILTPIAIAILAVTVIGIPLAIVIASLYVAALLLSVTFVSYHVGSWVLDRVNRHDAAGWTRMLIGAFVVSFALSIPFIGWVLSIPVVMAGAGALFLERRTVRQVA
jgi:cytoskeletal protein CcmA (bactofilin family)